MSFDPFGTSSQKEEDTSMPVFGAFTETPTSSKKTTKNEENNFSSFAENAFSEPEKKEDTSMPTFGSFGEPAKKENNATFPAFEDEKKEDTSMPTFEAFGEVKKQNATFPAFEDEKKEDVSMPTFGSFGETKKEENPAAFPAFEDEKKEDTSMPTFGSFGEAKKEENTATFPAFAEEKKEDTSMPTFSAFAEPKEEKFDPFGDGSSAKNDNAMPTFSSFGGSNETKNTSAPTVSFTSFSSFGTEQLTEDDFKSFSENLGGFSAQTFEKPRSDLAKALDDIKTDLKKSDSQEAKLDFTPISERISIPKPVAFKDTPLAAELANFCKSQLGHTYTFAD